MSRNRLILFFDGAILVAVVTCWILYLLFGHRLVGAMYRGESFTFLNSMIVGQGTYPLGDYLRVADRLMRLGSVLALGTAAAGSILLKILPSPLPSFSRCVVTALAPGLFLFGLSAATIVFFYPLEIETRESTLWLHTLALKAGVNIYDHSRVAFVNTQNGPFDSLFKLLVTTVLPFLDSWQVTRFAVFLLPWGFLVVGWSLRRRCSLGSWMSVLYLASLGYLFLVLSAREFLFVGRADATAALLLLPLMCLSFVRSPQTRGTTLTHGALSGVLGSAVVLTNWRIAPAVVAILGFAIFRAVRDNPVAGRRPWTYLAGYAVGGMAIAGFVFVALFHANPVLYYRHFFGIYTNASGWGHRPYSGSLIGFVAELLNPTTRPDTLKGGPLLLAIAVWALTRTEGDASARGWMVMAGVVFLASALAYYLNYDGGGAWYFIPFLMVLWFYLCTRYSAMPPGKQALLGLSVLVLLALNVPTVVVPALHRARTLRQAAAFMAQLRSLQQTNSIRSEDMFFYERSYQGELIDMGDTISAVSETGYYGEEFDRTVKRHFDQITGSPPDYIVTGFTASQELNNLIAARYVLVAQGPDNFTADGEGLKTRLFRRSDLAGPSKPQ